VADVVWDKKGMWLIADQGPLFELALARVALGATRFLATPKASHQKTKRIIIIQAPFPFGEPSQVARLPVPLQRHARVETRLYLLHCLLDMLAR
jgi:hypothetical protein